MTHQHWSTYWKSGAQTSLPTDFKNNYDGTIYDWWQQRIETLADKSTVLDVCTGNGAVALLLAEIALQQNKVLDITAVDISQINQVAILERHPKAVTDQIRFISHCPLEVINEHLQQPQNMIVSQFGLEYTNLNITSSLLYDLLMPKAELAFIAHSSESDIFNIMQVEDTIYTWLEDIGIFRIIAEYINQKISVNGLKNQLMATVSQHKPEIEFKSQPLFHSWQKTLSSLLNMPNQQLKNQSPKLKDYLKQHQAARLRAKDMLAVAKKLANPAWTNELLSANFNELENNPLIYKDKYKVGHTYRFKKN